MDLGNIMLKVPEEHVATDVVQRILLEWRVTFEKKACSQLPALAEHAPDSLATYNLRLFHENNYK